MNLPQAQAEPMSDPLEQHLVQDDARLVEILERTQRIAVLGISPRPRRAGHVVPAYLAVTGYTIVGVNPALEFIFDTVAYPNLSQIPDPVDLVLVFRRSEELARHLQEILALEPLPATVWTQLGVQDDAFARSLASHSIDVVQNRCMKVEHERLLW